MDLRCDFGGRKLTALSLERELRVLYKHVADGESWALACSFDTAAILDALIDPIRFVPDVSTMYIERVKFRFGDFAIAVVRDLPNGTVFLLPTSDVGDGAGIEASARAGLTGFDADPAHYQRPASSDGALDAYLRANAERRISDHIGVTWQDGPIKEHGENGAQVEDVIQFAIDRLRELNVEPHNNRYNSLAITELEKAKAFLMLRTLERLDRGVEGTNAV